MNTYKNDSVEKEHHGVEESSTSHFFVHCSACVSKVEIKISLINLGIIIGYQNKIEFRWKKVIYRRLSIVK